MNIKAILASLILGSSSVALAAPSVTVSATAGGSYTTPVVRDHRTGNNYETSVPPVFQPIYRPIGWNGGGHTLPPVYRPVTLASGLSFASRGRALINVGNQARPFATLQINAAGGRTFIQQVMVQFGNGQTQIIRNLDRTLSGNESLTVDLDGGRRNISRIVVYGKNINTGWHQSAGAFTVTAS
jgi:hypothetical protein